MTEQKNPFKDHLVGRLIMGRYRLVRRMAAGGMGVIYLARSEGAAGFVKPVVVKLIHPHFEANEEFSEMFIREAQIMSHLQHSGIVNVIDFTKEGETHVMVLEYVSGFQVKQWAKYRKFKRAPMPAKVSIQIVANVLDALDYAHTLKRPDGKPMLIVHRDISAANVMIDVDGRVKLLDFGIAFVNQGTASLGTQTSGFKGKLPYSAPELFSGAQAGVISDVYACGVVLHELLLGKNQFFAKDEQEVINRVLHHDPLPVLPHCPEAPQAIDDVLKSAMAKNPDDRYQNARDFRRALRDVLEEDDQIASERIASLAKDDFGREMAKFLKVEPLTDRDRAWRNPSIIPDPHIDEASIPLSTAAEILQGESRGTEGGPGAPDTVARPKNQSKALIIAIAVSLLVVAGLAGAYFLMNFKSDEKKQIYVVQSPITDTGIAPTATGGAKDPNDDTSLATHTDPEGDASPDDTKDDERVKGNETLSHGSEAKKPRSSRTGGGKDNDLGAAFRKRKRAVKGCFEKYASEMSGQPKIFINFKIDKRGRVQESLLSPASLGSTSLGQCLLNVANNTRFPMQDEPVAFRIPVTTWRGQKNMQ